MLFRRSLKNIFSYLFIFLLFSQVSFAWWNLSWSYRKQITINYTKVSSDQTNFPVLVPLTNDSDLATDARNDGYDIVFTNINSVKLDHEIEKFNGITDNAQIGAVLLIKECN